MPVMQQTHRLSVNDTLNFIELFEIVNVGAVFDGKTELVYDL